MAVLAVLTMTVGNVVALTQTNVKRMLAYSSIAHTGYILAGLAAFGDATTPAVQQQGIEAILFYVLGYGDDEHRRLRGGGHAAARPGALSAG